MNFFHLYLKILKPKGINDVNILTNCVYWIMMSSVSVDLEKLHEEVKLETKISHTLHGRLVGKVINYNYQITAVKAAHD